MRPRRPTPRHPEFGRLRISLRQGASSIRQPEGVLDNFPICLSQSLESLGTSSKRSGKYVGFERFFCAPRRNCRGSRCARPRGRPVRRRSLSRGRCRPASARDRCAMKTSPSISGASAFERPTAPSSSTSSIRTSMVVPIRDFERASDSSACSAMKRCQRSSFTSSGTWPASAEDAAPVTFSYLKQPARSISASS